MSENARKERVWREHQTSTRDRERRAEADKGQAHTALPYCSTTRMSWQCMESGESFQCPEFLYRLGTVVQVIERFPYCLVPVTFPMDQVLLSLPLISVAFNMGDLVFQLIVHMGRKWRRLAVSRGRIRSQHRSVKDRVHALGALRQLYRHSKAMGLQHFRYLKRA
jgi:hypothetical protein